MQLSVVAVSAPFVLTSARSLFHRMQGLLNFLWYGLNDSLKQAWLQVGLVGDNVSRITGNLGFGLV